MHRSSWALLTAAYLVACRDRGGETMTDGETSAGTTGATSQPTTGASTTDTGVDPCTPQPPSPLGPPVEIELVNMRADPVYIDGTYDCEPVAGYLIFPEGSKFSLVLDANCHFECPTVVAGGDCDCSIDCSRDQVRRIDPGVTFKTVWHGGELVPATVTADCAGNACDTTCLLPAGVPTGAYELHVQASSTADCEPDCTCPPGEAPCTLVGSRDPSDIVASLPFNYPEQTKLTLAFE